MDIAKIRKKLQELEANGQQPKASDPTVKPPEGRAAEKVEAHHEDRDRAGDAEDKLQTDQAARARSDMERPEPAPLKELEDKETSKMPETKKQIEPEKEEEIEEILTFRLTKEEFAFRISQIDEILRHQQVTRVPKVPDYVLGITSLRGKIIPVIDLKLKLSLTDKPLNNDQKGKILIIKGANGPVGAAVDKVVGVVRIAKSEILPPPSHLSEKELKFIEGVAVVEKRFVSIINMEETVSLYLI